MQIIFLLQEYIASSGCVGWGCGLFPSLGVLTIKYTSELIFDLFV
jgi:hypothetical protein